MLRFSLYTSVALIALSQAYAQGFNRVISFGDSHSDNGNSLPMYGFTQPAPHINGRLTNGLVWTELLATRLNGYSGASGSMDRIGVASFVQAPVNNAANNNYAVAGWAGQGMGTLVDAFSTNGGRYNPNNLVTVAFGSNDVTSAIAGGATVSTINTNMQTTVNSIATQMQRQIGQGARNFLVFNLHDRGDAPFFAGTANEAVARQGSVDFNAALPSSMRNLANANAGVNIIQMNFYGLQKAIQNNPNAFGFINSTVGCVSVASCAGGSFATQNQYFRWDQLHYTQAGHEIIARASEITLNYGRDIARVHTITDNAFYSRLSSMNAVFDKIQKANAMGGFASRGEIALEALGELRTTLSSDSRDATSTSLTGARLTYGKAITSAFSMGVIGSLQLGKVQQNNISYDSHTMAFDGFMSFDNQRFFMNGVVGFANNAFDNWKRSHQLGDLVNVGATKGRTVSASLELGKHFEMKQFVFTPLMRLSGIHTQVDGFTEEGVLSPLEFYGNSSQFVVGAVEARIDRRLVNLNMHGLIGAQMLLKSNGYSFAGNLANNSSLAQTNFVEAPKINGMYLGAGLDRMVSKNVGMGVDYRASLATDIQHRLNGGVKVAF